MTKNCFNCGSKQNIIRVYDFYGENFRLCHKCYNNAENARKDRLDSVAYFLAIGTAWVLSIFPYLTFGDAFQSIHEFGIAFLSLIVFVSGPYLMYKLFSAELWTAHGF